MVAGPRARPEPTGPGRPRNNPMYAQLLEAVLSDEGDPSAAPPTRTSGPLAEVVRLRHVLEKHADRTDPGWALQRVADQLAYDAALVRLARRRGVPIDLGSFDVPEYGRARLEEALIDKGVRLPPRSVPGPEADDAR